MFVAHEPEPEAEHPDVVPSVQDLHRKAVALSDPGDQDFVRSRRCRAQWPPRNVGRVGLAEGSKTGTRILTLPQLRSRECDLPHT